ncbi:hypothetical protein K438DRAFT_1749128 [Mycena galopus ATCC 62051]|nr:hypothetical protein K438DRAFT_1749128 [Mycena galopus ATCC 62051]
MIYGSSDESWLEVDLQALRGIVQHAEGAVFWLEETDCKLEAAGERETTMMGVEEKSDNSDENHQRAIHSPTIFLKYYSGGTGKKLATWRQEGQLRQFRQHAPAGIPFPHVAPPIQSSIETLILRVLSISAMATLPSASIAAHARELSADLWESHSCWKFSTEISGNITFSMSLASNFSILTAVDFEA